MLALESKWACVKYLTWAVVLSRCYLLVLAILSPGIGYDTSTSILTAAPSKSLIDPVPATLDHTALKLTRWDAIYYVSTASRGHLFEQEWAFGLGLSTPISQLNKCLLIVLRLQTVTDWKAFSFSSVHFSE